MKNRLIAYNKNFQELDHECCEFHVDRAMYSQAVKTKW